MTKLLTSTWMTALLSAVIYLGATVAFWKTPNPPPPSAADQAATAAEAPTGASWEFTNPEADQLIAELKDEKAALDKKAQQLNDLNVRLDAERTELNLVTQSVHQMQTDFDASVVRVQDSEMGNLKKLAKVYADMAPDSAANIFSKMDDVSVVKIMMFMKDEQTAGIFESIAKKGDADAKRAAGLSERLRVAAVHNPTAK
jgi:flagellar motility protein MotE (MotC chaperone)